MRCWFALVVIIGTAVMVSRYSSAGQLKGSKHDFSGGAGAADSCVFCHTSHGANAKAPLWNHKLSEFTYNQSYSSSTQRAQVGVPQAHDSTKLCLGCHDGTVALGDTVNNGRIPIRTGNPTLRPTDRGNVGTNLADDHPTAFTPNYPVPPGFPQVQKPPADDAVKLDPSGRMQCVSCHDPHKENQDPTEQRFLVKINEGSAICLSCHVVQNAAGAPVAWSWGWNGQISDHKTKLNSYTATTNNPGGSDSSLLGAHTGYSTTASNGCAACHRPHAAHGAERLMKGDTDQICFQCHDGNATTKIANVKAAFNKVYKHPGTGTTQSGHDPSEAPLISSARHAACDDCHNPHAAKGYSTPPLPPNVSSSLVGVSGVNRSGGAINPRTGTGEVAYQYEICFKCHGDSPNQLQRTDTSTSGTGFGRLPLRWDDFPNDSNCSTPNTTRANLRLKFTDHATYPSFHPLVDPLNRPITGSPGTRTVPSLRRYVRDMNGADILSRPLGPQALIYCTDCHNNDDMTSSGPHGSSNAHLLERTNQQDINTPDPCRGNVAAVAGSWTAASFKLCDKCHDVSNNPTTGLLNREPHTHVSNRGATCTSCHDPHASKNPQLINFDKQFVGPYNDGVIHYLPKTSAVSGQCQLTCHQSTGKYHSYSY